MSSSTAKFVPTLGGRVWRLQRQGVQTVNAAIKADASSSTSNNSASFMQRSAATYSTSSSNGSWGQSKQAGSSWSQRP